jgi:hypothetical protein
MACNLCKLLYPKCVNQCSKECRAADKEIERLMKTLHEPKKEIPISTITDRFHRKSKLKSKLKSKTT